MIIWLLYDIIYTENKKNKLKGNRKMSISKKSGIYVIVNIEKCKIYVGQAREFNNRDHSYELKKGYDSSELQQDYNNVQTELVYFIVGDFVGDFEKADLNMYEKLYMTLMEEVGLDLYNKQCNDTKNSKNNRAIDKLGVNYIVYNEIKENFINEFKKRFDVIPQDLKKLSVNERKSCMDKYVKKRLNINSKELEGDRLIFNRDRIKNIIYNKSISVTNLNIDEMFVSKAGNYLDEGIDQILDYEINSIKTHGYCLWTFASKAVSYEIIKKSCEKRRDNNLDTYVLFEYTTSSEYAASEATRFNKLRKKYVNELTSEEKLLLNFEKGKYGNYYVPDDIDCTAVGNKSAKAFVISEIFMLDEIYNIDELNNYYSALGAKDLYKIKDGGKQRSTFYVKANNENIDLSEIFENPNDRKICFVGKLVSPFILNLEKDA